MNRSFLVSFVLNPLRPQSTTSNVLFDSPGPGKMAFSFGTFKRVCYWCYIKKVVLGCQSYIFSQMDHGLFSGRIGVLL